MEFLFCFHLFCNSSRYRLTFGSAFFMFRARGFSTDKQLQQYKSGAIPTLNQTIKDGAKENHDGEKVRSLKLILFSR